MLLMKLIFLVHGLPRWQMIREEFTALVQEGGFGQNEGEKETFLMFTLSMLCQIMRKTVI
jgi:hypothetical protein